MNGRIVYLAPVRLGNGTKIHAGIVSKMRNDRLPRAIREWTNYSQICGSGKCSTGTRRWSNILIVPGLTLADVDCEECLRIMAQHYQNAVPFDPKDSTVPVGDVTRK